MATKKVAVERKLKPNQILIAEGTDLERVVDLKIPRGKQYRNKHLRLLETFGELENVAKDGVSNLKSIIEVINNLFGSSDDFEDEMVPFVLSMDSNDDLEFLDNLTPMEKFTAYMQAASYIVGGGQTEATDTALKK